PDVRREHEVEIALERFVTLDAAAVEGRLRADVPIHAQYLFATGLIDRALEDGVEVAARVVGQREDVKQLLPVGVNPVEWNDVQALRVVGGRAHGVAETTGLIVGAGRRVHRSSLT